MRCIYEKNQNLYAIGTYRKNHDHYVHIFVNIEIES